MESVISSTLSERDIEEWRRNGWLLKRNVFGADEVLRAFTDARALFPPPGTGAASAGARDQFSQMAGFPFQSIALSNLATSPTLGNHTRALLQSDDVQLFQAELWAKYPGVTTYEQTHHRDYAKNTLGFVGPDEMPAFLGAFVYLQDVSERDGPTALVSRELTRNYPLEPARLSANDDPSLYSSEHLATADAGSVLYFAGDVFHRATEVLPDSRGRVLLKLAIKQQSATWVGYHRPIRIGFEPWWSRYMLQASPAQWRLLGAPADAGWQAEAVRRRYIATEAESRGLQADGGANW